MGRKVSFKIEGSLLESEIVKVDRTKLYGTSEKIVYDTNKEECVLSDLYEGSIILPRGSVGQVLIDENGNSEATNYLSNKFSISSATTEIKSISNNKITIQVNGNGDDAYKFYFIDTSYD